MKREKIRLGETYFLPVVATEVIEGGNMVRLVTEDDGAVIHAHPKALYAKKKTLDYIPVKKGGRK